VVTGTDNGAEEFIEAAWKGGDVFVDEAEAFKKAVHGGSGRSYSTWWLLKPWVIKDVLSFAKRFGSYTGDVTDSKTQILGGTMVIKPSGEVIYLHKETSSFDNGDAKDLLAAVLGRPLSDADVVWKPTPSATEAVCTKADAATDATACS